VDERLEVKPDPTVQVGPMDPLDVVEPSGEYLPPSEGSRRCMIYRPVGDTVER
jgi:hypothetical protein